MTEVRRWLGIAGVLAALITAGCGGSSSQTSTAPGPPGPQAGPPGTTAPPGPGTTTAPGRTRTQPKTRTGPKTTKAKPKPRTTTAPAGKRGRHGTRGPAATSPGGTPSGPPARKPEQVVQAAVRSLLGHPFRARLTRHQSFTAHGVPAAVARRYRKLSSTSTSTGEFQSRRRFATTEHRQGRTIRVIVYDGRVYARVQGAGFRRLHGAAARAVLTLGSLDPGRLTRLIRGVRAAGTRGGDRRFRARFDQRALLRVIGRVFGATVPTGALRILPATHSDFLINRAGRVDRIERHLVERVDLAKASHGKVRGSVVATVDSTVRYSDIGGHDIHVSPPPGAG